jgi:hypothetical protein
MNKEDIIKLAIEHTIHGLKFDEDGLVRFANLVAQHEREACAMVCEDSVEYAGDTLAEAIRARGQALAEKSSEEIETIVYKYSTLYGRRPNDN